MHSYIQLYVNYVVKLKRYDNHQGDFSLHMYMCVYLNAYTIAIGKFWCLCYSIISDSPLFHALWGTSGSTISEACQHEQLVEFRYPVPDTNNRHRNTDHSHDYHSAETYLNLLI